MLPVRLQAWMPALPGQFILAKNTYEALLESMHSDKSF